MAAVDDIYNQITRNSRKRNGRSFFPAANAQGQTIQFSGSSTPTRVGTGFGPNNGLLPPDQNPAYQAALNRPRQQYTTIQLPSGGTASVPVASKQNYLDIIQPRGPAQDRAEVSASLAGSDPKNYAIGYGARPVQFDTSASRVQSGRAGFGDFASVLSNNALRGLGAAPAYNAVVQAFGGKPINATPTAGVNAATQYGQNLPSGADLNNLPNPFAGFGANIANWFRPQPLQRYSDAANPPRDYFNPTDRF